MGVKDFKFVSPGVFINEIDNSNLPKKADTIGPIVIGRARRGLGMQPVKVESYSQFVEMFGETVPAATYTVTAMTCSRRCMERTRPRHS